MSGFGTKKLKASADEFIHLFVNQPEWLSKFLEFIVSNGSASPLVYNTLLELYLRNETVCIAFPLIYRKRDSLFLDLHPLLLEKRK